MASSEGSSGGQLGTFVVAGADTVKVVVAGGASLPGLSVFSIYLDPEKYCVYTM